VSHREVLSGAGAFPARADRREPLLRRVGTFILRHRLLLILTTHALLTAVAYGVAFALRFDFTLPDDVLGAFQATVLLLVIIRLAAFGGFGLHRGFWRHFGQQDLVNLTKSVSLGSLVFLVAIAAAGQLGPVPRAVLALEWMVSLLLAGGLRFGVRCVREGRFTRRPRDEKRVLVVGAGAAGERLVRQFARGEGGEEGEDVLRVVAIVDDDPAKQRMALHGVRVAGTVDQVAEVVARHRIDLVVIAISRATPSELRRIVELCLKAKIEFKRLPSMREMLAGGARRAELTDVELEHLLVREPVVLDEELVGRDLRDSVVLITGGAGSVGSELARQIARHAPERLILVEQAESALYFVHLELQRTHPAVETIPIVADITDGDTLAQIFERYRPDHVYHAAAYKHVPMMEANAVEAVRNNVLGTLRVAECAARSGVRKFVLISTDKAVRPSSVMGATKRVAERIVLGWPTLREARTEFRAVRFGNVLGSDGSVVPLFRKQLARGGPITVTHPDVSRYFMTLPEAAQLVLQAAALPQAAGRITMLEMGEQVRILDLAENLVRLSGLEPYRDVEIVFTGLRPGEKLREELMSAAELTVPSGVEKISIVQTDEVSALEVRLGVEQLLYAAARHDVAMVHDALRDLVPECVAPLRDAVVEVPSALPIERELPLAGAVEGGRRVAVGDDVVADSFQAAAPSGRPRVPTIAADVPTRRQPLKQPVSFPFA
jgi:FlaA1/EpsC-like NDP-sugar epimerase